MKHAQYKWTPIKLIGSPYDNLPSGCIPRIRVSPETLMKVHAMKKPRKPTPPPSPIAAQHALLKASRIVPKVIRMILAKSTDYFHKNPDKDFTGCAITVSSEPSAKAIVAMLSALPDSFQYADYTEPYPDGETLITVGRTWRIRALILRATKHLPESPAKETQ